MNTVKIMPCLDMKNGRVVKGIHFVERRDAGDPVENASQGSDPSIGPPSLPETV